MDIKLSERQYAKFVRSHLKMATPDYLAVLRRNGGLTMLDVATAVERKTGVVCDMECGRRVLSLAMAAKLSTALLQPSPQELIRRSLNGLLEREGLAYRVTRLGLESSEETA